MYHSPVRAVVPTGDFLAPNGASYDTKIGCIQFLWTRAKKYKFSFLPCAGPLNE